MIENTISIDSTDVAENMGVTSYDETKVQNKTCVEDERDELSATENVMENEELSDTQTTEKYNADQQEMTVELTVYGEKHKVPLSQAVIAAQKGMAFDHIKQQLADMKNDYRITALDQVAQMQGKNTYELLAELQHKAVADGLIGRYGSFDNVPTEELGKAVQTIAMAEKQLKESRMVSDYYSWKNQLADFVSENPGCGEIPEEVIDAARKGEKISDAYSRIHGNILEKELTEAKREISILKGENNAVKNSTPSAKSVGGDGTVRENEYLKFMKSTW